MAEGGDNKDHHETPLTLHIRNLPQSDELDELFVMFLENTTGEDGFNIEYSNALNEALVMLDNLSIDSEDVKNRIRQKPFLSSTLEVEDAAPNNRVWVTNLKPNVDKDTLELYFEQGKLNPSGGSVEVEYDDLNHNAIITYSDASAVETVLSADHSKTQVLGPKVVIEPCKFFDSLYTSAESVGTEEPVMPDDHDGEDVNDEQRVEADETNASPDEAGIGPVDQGRGKGRGNRRGGGRRGERRGGRRGRAGFGPEGQRVYERRDSESSQHSEPPPYGEISMQYDQRGAPMGNRRPRRGRGAMGDMGRPRYPRDRRPQSASRGEYSADQVVGGANNGDSAPRGRPWNRRGEHQYYNPRGGRWGDGGPYRGQGRGGMNQRTGSIPSLLDQPLSLPTDSAGSVHKEIEVQKEAGSEKCHLLTTMIRDVKSHGCEARIDMRRHCVTLNGPSAAVTAATETVYSQLLAMHSIELEFPARFAQLLATPRGHNWVVTLFKSAQLRAIYYINERSIPSIVASDEHSANIAKSFLIRNIKGVEIPYVKWHRNYLQSDVWLRFVDSTEKTRLLNIEVTLSNVIRIIGVEEDVNAATDSVQSQLRGVEKPAKSKSGYASKPEQDPRPDELPGEQLLQQLPAALDSAEVSEVCPICGLAFPQSTIADHANMCSSSKVCPICSLIFPATTPVSVFSMHVNGHFEDSV